MENERDFDPQTMTMATAEDFSRMWRELYGNKLMKPSKYGSFHAMRLGGYVYIARDEDGNLKVGAANNVEKRMCQHKKKYGILKLVAVIYAKRFMELEKFVHYELEPFQVYREWFFSEDEKDIFGKIENLLNKHGELFEAELIQYK